MDSQIRVRMTNAKQKERLDQSFGLDFSKALLGIVERCFSTFLIYAQAARRGGLF